MLKNKLFPYIEKYINEYLYGFTSEQLNVGVMNGEIVLDRLNIRPDRVNDKLDSLEIPIWLKAGQIRKIRISCSLMNFIGEKPLEVYVDDVDLLLTPSFKWILKNIPTFIEENEHHMKEPYDSMDNNSHDIFNKKVNIYDSSVIKRKQKLFEIFTDKSKISEIINKVFTKCLKFYYQKPYLINFKIRNVHLRFEDDQLINYNSDIALGVKIKNFEINLTADGMTKKNNFKLENINLYWEPNPNMFIPMKHFTSSLDRDNIINEKYYDYLTTVKFNENINNVLLIDNFNCMGNFGILLIDSGNLDFFAKNREKNFKFFFQTATSELNLNFYPDLINIIERILDFTKSFFIIEPIQDFKPMRKPYNNLSETLKKLKSENKNENETFGYKRKMIVRDWLYYLVWFNRFKKAIYGNVFKNPLHTEFSKYFNICCIHPETDLMTNNSNLNDSILIKKNESKNNSILLDGKSNKKNIPEEDLNPDNINLTIFSEILIKGLNLHVYPKYKQNDKNFILIKIAGFENKVFISKDKFEFSFDLKSFNVHTLNNKLTIAKHLDEKIKEEIVKYNTTTNNNNFNNNVNKKLQNVNESINFENNSVYNNIQTHLNDEVTNPNNISIMTNNNPTNSLDYILNKKLNRKLNVLTETLDKISRSKNLESNNLKILNSKSNFNEKTNLLNLNFNNGNNLKDNQSNFNRNKSKVNFVNILLAEQTNIVNEEKLKINLSKVINEYNKGINNQKKVILPNNNDKEKNSKIFSTLNNKNNTQDEKIHLNLLEIYPNLYLNKLQNNAQNKIPLAPSVIYFKLTKSNSTSKKSNEDLIFNFGHFRANLAQEYLSNFLNIISEYSFIKKIKSTIELERNKFKEIFNLKNHKNLFELKNSILEKLNKNQLSNNKNSKTIFNIIGTGNNNSNNLQQNNDIKEYKNYLKNELQNYEKSLSKNGRFEVNYIFNYFNKTNLEINFNFSDLNLIFFNSGNHMTSHSGKLKIPNFDFKFSFQSDLQNFYVKLFEFEFNFFDSENLRIIVNNLIQIIEEKFKYGIIFIQPVIKKILEERVDEENIKNKSNNNIKNISGNNFYPPQNNQNNQNKKEINILNNLQKLNDDNNYHNFFNKNNKSKESDENDSIMIIGSEEGFGVEQTKTHPDNLFKTKDGKELDIPPIKMSKNSKNKTPFIKEFGSNVQISQGDNSPISNREDLTRNDKNHFDDSNTKSQILTYDNDNLSEIEDLGVILDTHKQIHQPTAQAKNSISKSENLQKLINKKLSNDVNVKTKKMSLISSEKKK